MKDLIPMLLWLLSMGMSVGTSVCLGLAAYHDAKSKMNSNAVMWGVLVGVFGFIPGIIYLCVRNNPTLPPVYCRNCGLAYPVNSPGCPRCGLQNPYAASAYNPDAPVQAKRAKTLLIVGICLFAGSILTEVIGISFMIITTPSLA